MKQILSEKEIVKRLWLGRVADLQFQQEVERELIDFRLAVLEAVEKWVGEYSQECGACEEKISNLSHTLACRFRTDLLSFLKEAREGIEKEL